MCVFLLPLASSAAATVRVNMEKKTKTKYIPNSGARRLKCVGECMSVGIHVYIISSVSVHAYMP